MDQSKVIAVDLNGTLASGRGPDPAAWGEPTPGAADAMAKLKDAGYTLVINSVVGDTDAIEGWLTKYDLARYFSAINESPAQPEGSSGKLNAVAYLDDRVVPFRGDWEETLADLFECGVLEKRLRIKRVVKVYEDIHAAGPTIVLERKSVDELDRLIERGSWDQVIDYLLDDNGDPAKVRREVGKLREFSDRLEGFFDHRDAARELLRITKGAAMQKKLPPDLKPGDAVDVPIGGGKWGEKVVASVTASHPTPHLTEVKFTDGTKLLLRSGADYDVKSKGIVQKQPEGPYQSPWSANSHYLVHVPEDMVRNGGRKDVIVWVVVQNNQQPRDGHVFPDKREATAWLKDNGFERKSMTVSKHQKRGELLSTDDDERSATFVLTTGTKDRDGETVDPTGGNFDEYQDNPVVCFNHDTDDFPIGRCEKLWADEVNGQPALLGKVVFSKENPKGDLAYRMVKEGMLKGCSISFLPLGDVSKNDAGGNHYSKWKLLEWSVCPVGSNPDAVTLQVKRLVKLCRVKSLGRKCWVKAKSAMVLKSEGDLDEQQQEYLEGLGLEDVQIEDAPPPEDEGWEPLAEPKEEYDWDQDPPVENSLPQGGPYLVEQTTDGKWMVRRGDGKQFGPYDSREEADTSAQEMQKSIDKGTAFKVGDLVQSPSHRGCGTVIRLTPAYDIKFDDGTRTTDFAANMTPGVGPDGKPGGYCAGRKSMDKGVTGTLTVPGSRVHEVLGGAPKWGIGIAHRADLGGKTTFFLDGDRDKVDAFVSQFKSLEKAEDIAEGIAERVRELCAKGAEETAALDAAMVECAVPEGMEKAVRSLVKQKAPGDPVTVEVKVLYTATGTSLRAIFALENGKLTRQSGDASVLLQDVDGGKAAAEKIKQNPTGGKWTFVSPKGNEVKYLWASYKGKSMTRKCWRKGNKAWVLKSDGPLSEASSDALIAEGVDEVVMEEEGPIEETWKAMDDLEEKAGRAKYNIGQQVLVGEHAAKITGQKQDDKGWVYTATFADGSGGTTVREEKIRENPFAKSTDDLADAVVERAAELVEQEVPVEAAVDAAATEQQVPEEMSLAVKGIALKRLRRKSFGFDDEDESGPTGLKALKRWVKMIEDDTKAMHKAEQGVVMDAGEKALKIFKACLSKAYGDTGEEEVIEEQVVETSKRRKRFKKAADLEPGDKLLKADGTSSEVESTTEKDACVKVACDDGTQMSIKSDAEVAVEEKAGSLKELQRCYDRGVADQKAGKSRTQNPYSGFTGQSEWLEGWDDASKGKPGRRRPKSFDDDETGEKRSKRLSKAATSVVQDAVDFLEDAADASDTPKRLKGGMIHHSRNLKELTKVPEPDPVEEPPVELSLEQEKALSSKVGDLLNGVGAMNDRIYRATGVRLN